MSRRSRTIASIAGAGALAALLVTGTVPAQASGNYEVVTGSSYLRDFATSAANPTDGAYATLIAAQKGNRSTFVLAVTGMNAAPGTTFGAHVHTGTCAPDAPTAAGPHWRTAASDPIDPKHEVWLDFTVKTGGFGFAKTKVPFVIPDGAAHSVVIHALPTAVGPTPPAGVAGPRLACLPVDF